MGGGDGVRAWRFLRRNRQYRASWLRIRPPPGLAERAPFAVRLQTAADLSAARFGLLAWLDPFARDGPASPFWAEAPGGIALTGMAAVGAASVTGLRTGDGALVLKIERPGTAVQVRPRDGGVFPDEGGLSLLREVVRIEDLWEGPCTPSPPRGAGDGDDELPIALDGALAGRSERGIAEELFGREEVAAHWSPDGWMRSRVRRRLARARKLAASGYRDIAAGRPAKA